MDIHLHSQERIRVSTNKGNPSFMDLECGKHEGCISVESYQMHILQIRRKANVIKMFAFHSDGYLKDYDFGWWSDADIIWTNL